MAKVLSSNSSGIGKTTKNNTPPKGKPNIGPGSTVGSRSGGASNKPTGSKTAPMTAFSPKTMRQKAPASRMSRSVPGRGAGAGLPKASGAMGKFGGGK